MIGRQLKMEALLQGVPQLADSLEASADAAQHAAVAITTTDLVSKSAALEASCSSARCDSAGCPAGCPNMTEPASGNVQQMITVTEHEAPCAC